MKFGEWAWADQDDEAVYESFRGERWGDDAAPHVEPVGEILCAAYDSRDYSGEAVVILRIDGVLHEVYGSHCSCYGLEGQWDPKPVEPVEFRARMTREQQERQPDPDDGYHYGPDLRAAYDYIVANMTAWGV